jgi:hypothetical protein
MHASERLPLPRWLGALFLLIALGLGPWTLWLTYSLPSRHITRHYDLAWIVFDIALLCAFAVTGWCVLTESQWLAPAAAATGTMLLCDAWFDIVTSAGGSEMTEAVLEACFAELPLAGLCAYIVVDRERFLATLLRGRRQRGRGVLD